MRRTNRTATWIALAAALGATGLLGAACESRAAEPAPTHPMVLIGIDGADWNAIERLWGEGRLPHLKALCERGTRLPLGTDYKSHSPVVWTTIATAVAPDKHGIEDFVRATDEGDVPLSSSLRKVPALWNILTMAGLRVAVLGWWASWPAEEINGTMVTDRCFLDLEQAVHPPEFGPEFQAGVETALAAKDPDEEGRVQKRDWVVAHFAPQVVAEDHDLVMVYFKMVDRTGHLYWKYFEPEHFPEIPEDEMREHEHRVTAAYEEVDEALGRIVGAAGPDTNILVVSDHGMIPQIPEKIRVSLNISTVLERLGLLVRKDGKVDFSESLVYPYSASGREAQKAIRYSLSGREEGGRVRPEERLSVLQQVEAALSTVTYDSGAPTFAVRNEQDKGGDFLVEVLTDRATVGLVVDGEPFSGAVKSVTSISGNHTASVDGILIAAGPDFVSDADLEVSIHGIGSTVLYALGLPVAEDTVGGPYLGLFEPSFAESRPVETITSWGTRREATVTTSDADEALIEELRKIGYLR